MITTAAPIRRSSVKRLWDAREWSSFAVIGPALFGCTLWDFYIQGAGVRPFDVLTVLGLIVAATSGAFGTFRLLPRNGRHVALVWLVVVVYSLVGTFTDVENARPVLGFLLGIMTFALALMAPIASPRVLITATSWSLVVHCAAFWAQFIAYYRLGVLINYHGWLGGDPRVFSDVFRACGLFLEPANFALTIFLLVTLRLHAGGKLDRMVLFALATSCASLSLWGCVSTTLLLVSRVWRSKLFIIVCIALVFVVASLLPMLDELSKDLWLLRRVSTLGSDSSTSIRYGVLFTNAGDVIWDPETWFGTGITNNYQLFGASGLGYIIRSLGLVGLAAFLTAVCVGAPRGEKPFITACTAMALTATTFWTDVFWWFWLAMLLRPIPGHDAGTAGPYYPLPRGEGGAPAVVVQR